MGQIAKAVLTLKQASVSTDFIFRLDFGADYVMPTLVDEPYLLPAFLL